ncbi:type II toxin-antitoxin system HicA family toxin [Hymenobacter caeli]|uniref:type II toxin-antitoxin system HicA family toxin n=1 Tax=Hymenobacter caeli TaxID=2735894 RepID=UPI001570217E|nr:type II toxin-antitoxin system HicA family toxin [Hymenobacter caeli]
MKCGKCIKYLEANNCPLHRRSSRHDIYKNTLTGKRTSVPRHGDIDEDLCREICKQLEIPKV